MTENKKGLLALSPLLVFIVLYLVTSIISGDFYKVPITVAFMISSIFAIAISGGFPLAKRIEIYSKGASTDNMMMMLWIFVLAGAFANSAKDMGSIDATVNLTLSVLPDNMLLPGLFLAACFISISIGTSVGTIVALTPIAAGIATSTNSSLPFVVAIVVGGSFFGDNLSFISDTTVVATRTQECKMADKFKVNFFIVAPAAVLILLGYVFMGRDIHTVGQASHVDFYRVIPYMAVLICAVFGMNVMAYDLYPDHEFAKQYDVKVVSLDELYANSDIISLHCPLTPDTKFLINQDSIAKMKKGVMIINTGRGKLINTEDLIEGLRSKQVGSAGLDVYEEEREYFYEDKSDKMIDDDVLARLLMVPNVVLTSHQAFFTAEALHNIAVSTLDSVKEFAEGKDLTCEVKNA